MSKRVPTFLAILALILLVSWVGPSARQATSVGQGPAMSSIGPLTFGPDGTLCGRQFGRRHLLSRPWSPGRGGAPGANAIDGLDTTLAGLLGTGAKRDSDHRPRRAPEDEERVVSVMRGQGAGATPTLFRIDGAGKIQMVTLNTLKFQKADIGNAPAAAAGARNPRAQVVTDMAFSEGRLWVAGLSNEEFASKLRAIPVPFTSVDANTSVEIYHGNHQQLETRSP